MPGLLYCPFLKPGLQFYRTPGLHPAAEALIAGLNGEHDADAAIQEILSQHGFRAAAEAQYALRLCAGGNSIDYAVRSGGVRIATLRPLRAGYEWKPERTGRELSRFAFLRAHEGRLLLECPAAGARIELEPSAAARSLAALPGGDPADPVWQLLGEAGFLESDAANAVPAAFWEFHDLLFHTSSRAGMGRRVGATVRFQGIVEMPPAVKPPLPAEPIPLTADTPAQPEPRFFEVLERRRSIREPGPQPITIEQLGAFLHRSVAIRRQTQEGGMEILFRPYPSGGAIHELEFYLAVHQCRGLARGFYHYHAANHALYAIPAEENLLNAVIGTALISWGGRFPAPNVFFTIAARLPRIAWKYEGMAYRTILLNAGAALQTMYLAATALGLAPCAVGNGDPSLFRAITGLDPMEETSVAEFALSSAS